MAIANDVIRKQGDTYPIEVTVLKDGGAPIDLTGATSLILGIAMTEAITAPDEPELLLTGTVAEAETGKVNFNISASEADNLASGDYYAEIQFEQGGYIITTETFRYRVKGQIVM